MYNSKKKTYSPKKILQKRLVGSLLDKVYICLLTVLIVIVVSFFYQNIAGDAGVFTALFHMNTNDVYSTAIGHVMSEYPGDRIIEHQYDIDKYFSYLKGIEISILLLFSLINIVYYFFSEMIYKASLGKKSQNLILVSNKTGVKITATHVLFRIIVFALMMVFFFLFRWTIGVNYYVITVLFFLTMDLPVLYSNRSLLDILTNTKLIFIDQQTTALNTVEERKTDNKQMDTKEEPFFTNQTTEKDEMKNNRYHKYFIYYTLLCSIINISLIIDWFIWSRRYDYFLGIKVQFTGTILLILTFLLMNITALYILHKATKKEYSWDFMLWGNIRKQVHKLAKNESEVKAFVVLFCYPFFVLGQLPYGIMLLCYLVPLALILSIVLTVRWILADDSTKENRRDALFKDYYLILDLEKNATQDDVHLAYNKALTLNKYSKLDLQEAYKVLSSENRLRPAYDREYLLYDQMEDSTIYQIKDKKLIRDIEIIRKSLNTEKKFNRGINVNAVLLSFLLLAFLGLLLFSCVNNNKTKEHSNQRYHRNSRRVDRRRSSAINILNYKPIKTWENEIGNT